jgi:hypothetical protein
LKIVQTFDFILHRNEVFALEAGLHFLREVSKSNCQHYREQIFKSGILVRVVELATHSQRTISHFSLMIFRAMFLGFYSAHNIQQLMTTNIVEILPTVFKEKRFMVKTKREGLFIIKSFVMKGTRVQSRMLFENNHEELWISICSMMKSNENSLVAECVKLINCIDQNLLSPSTQWIIDQLDSFGVIENMVDLLHHIDDGIHEIVYEFLISVDHPVVAYHPECYGANEE